MDKGIRFEVTQFFKVCAKFDDEWKLSEGQTNYTVDNWDDLQNLLITLIDFGDDETKFRVRKQEVAE